MLELGQISWAKCICLGHNGNEVDASTQTLHDLNIERFQSVASRANEVQAGMHSQINLLRSARLLFLQHIALMLIVQELDDWLPAVAVVDIVAETRSVDNGKPDLEELLFQLGLGDFNLNSLVDLLGVTAAMVGVVLDGCAKEGVDEGGLAQAGLPCYHDSEGRTTLGYNFVALVGELCATLSAMASAHGAPWCGTYVGNANGAR